MELKLYKFGQETGAKNIKVSDDIFAAPVSNDMILEVLRWQRAKRRAGTADVKNRGEIKCSTKKIYRQKGTGSARHGAKSAPIFVGGGVAFGPTPRSYEFKLNKKFRIKALKAALSLRASKEGLKVVENFDIDKVSTKELQNKTNAHSQDNMLIVDSEISADLKKSTANLHKCKVLPASALNVYDLIKYKTILLSKSAVKDIEERFNV